MLAVSQPAKAHALEVTHDGRPITVAVAAIAADSDLRLKPGWSAAVAKAALRVNLASWERLNIEADIQFVDRWLMRWENELRALTEVVLGYAPPYPGHVLRHQRIALTDPWVGHIVTVAGTTRYRDSRWIVVRA